MFIINEINSNTIICGHHVYKSIWTSSIGQVLSPQLDVQKEALDYDKYAVSVFKRHKEDFSQLDLEGHAPIELASLLNQFLKADVGTSIYVKIIGKRKREDLWCQQTSPPAQNVVKQQKFLMNNC